VNRALRMEVAPRRRRAGGLVAVLAVLAALVVGVIGAAAPRAAAVARPTITIATLDPTVGTPGGRLHVTGSVTGGTLRLSDVQVSLRLSRTRVNSRAELAGVASGETTGKDGDVIANQAVPGTLLEGEVISFDLGADLDRLPQLREFGVYVVAVEVTATHRDGSGSVAITRTFLPWVPTQRDFAPTSFAWLWPLVDRPSMVSDGTFVDDSLAESLKPGGRLARLTAAGAQLGQRTPLTWAVDPDLLDTVNTMSQGYTVRSDGDGTEGTGTPAARSWLDQVRTATAGSEVLALPYADPDLVALRRHGLPDDIARARELGTDVTNRVLQRDVASDIADGVTSDVSWPVDGYIDRATLGVLRRSGINTVVLDGRAQPTRLELNYTPSGRGDVASGGATMASLVADPALTNQLGRTERSPLLAAQRFLAETAMITAELPNAGTDRVILVAPPRRWNPSQEFLDRLLTGISSAAWMSGATLSDMRAAPAAEVERRTVRYPKAVQTHELPGPYLTALKSQHRNNNVFNGVLADRANRARIMPALTAGLLRLESSWWRGRDERVNRLNLEQTHIADLLKAVHVQPGAYTFGSKSGDIPLTIANETDYDVRVVLQLEPDQRLRLQPVPPVVINANRKVQVEVKASAVASGTAQVIATLRTPAGAEVGPPVLLRIRITQFGTAALLITMVAAAVLVLAALVRLARRARAARRARRGGPAGGPPDEHGPHAPTGEHEQPDGHSRPDEAAAAPVEPAERAR
jgi:hypothetical protein